jgi:membrane protein DedA with SNARE-associated domain
MHSLAATGQAAPLSPWAYLAVFAAAAAGYMGVPVVATAVIGFAAVLASQGSLNIAAVLVVAALGCEAGGLGGYRIGDRWGRNLLERPGPGLAWRKKAVAKGEAVYQKWGRLAVFVTPSIVSGVLEMKFRQFAVWNFLAGTAFVLAVGPSAYGVGKVSTGHHDPASLGMLIGGLAVAAACLLLGSRYYHRRKARRSSVATAAGPGKSLPGPSRPDGDATSHRVTQPPAGT